jgi:hypothetical protein
MKIILFFLVAVTSLVLGTSFHESFSELENTYTNEKCGVSIKYPEDWTVEESDFVFKDQSKELAEFSPEDDPLLYGVSIQIQNFGLAKKSMGEISEFQRDFATAYPDSTIIHSGITEINGFPTHKIVYSEGLMGEYEFEEEEARTMTYLIIAYDREYELTFQANDKEEFDKYSSTVEEMANSIKITKPNFEGVKC